MSLKKHYINLFQKNGANHNAVQYSSAESQYKRFEILCELIRPTDKVLDLGCGLGDMLTFLRHKKEFKGTYLGLDFVPDFIHHAQTAFQDDLNSSFSLFDIQQDPLPENYDVILLSGVFNNEMEDNWDFITNSLIKMHAASNRVVTFNALSTYVDYQDKGLYYTDPLKLFHFCKNELSAFITLRHDYLVKENSIPFEFTMHLNK